MKTKVICLHLMLLIGSVAVAQVAPSLDPCAAGPTRALVNWPEFRFNLCHSGYNPYEFILSPANVGNLVLFWTSAINEHSWNSPVVINGVVYVGSGDWGDWNVYALAAGTGVVSKSKARALSACNCISWEGA